MTTEFSQIVSLLQMVRTYETRSSSTSQQELTESLASALKSARNLDSDLGLRVFLGGEPDLGLEIVRSRSRALELASILAQDLSIAIAIARDLSEPSGTDLRAINNVDRAPTGPHEIALLYDLDLSYRRAGDLATEIDRMLDQRTPRAADLAALLVGARDLASAFSPDRMRDRPRALARIFLRSDASEVGKSSGAKNCRRTP